MVLDDKQRRPDTHLDDVLVQVVSADSQLCAHIYLDDTLQVRRCMWCQRTTNVVLTHI